MPRMAISCSRYEENRRPHPMRKGSLVESITAERALLSQLRESADVVIDTTDLNVHQLRGQSGGPFRGVDRAASDAGFGDLLRVQARLAP